MCGIQPMNFYFLLIHAYHSAGIQEKCFSPEDSLLAPEPSNLEVLNFRSFKIQQDPAENSIIRIWSFLKDLFQQFSLAWIQRNSTKCIQI